MVCVLLISLPVLSSIHLSVCPSIHAFLHSFIHSLIRSFIPSFIYTFIHSLIRSFFACNFIHCFFTTLFRQEQLEKQYIHLFKRFLITSNPNTGPFQTRSSIFTPTRVTAGQIVLIRSPFTRFPIQPSYYPFVTGQRKLLRGATLTFRIFGEPTP